MQPEANQQHGEATKAASSGAAGREVVRPLAASQAHAKAGREGSAGSERMFTTLGKLFALLSRRAKRNSGILLLMMVFSALLEVVGVAAIPAFISTVMNPDDLARLPIAGNTLSALSAGSGGMLVVWGACALIVLFGLKSAFLTFNHYCQARYMTNRRIDLASRLTNAYMRAPYAFHLAHNTAELLRNIDREVNIIAYQVFGAILEVCTRTFILVAVLIFLFVMEPWITLFWLLIFGTIGAVCVHAVSAKLKRYGLEEQSQRRHFIQALYQGFGSIKETRILSREPFFAGKVNDSIARMSEVFGFKLFTGKIVPPVTEFIAITGLLGLAAALVLMGRPSESILVTLSLFVVGLVRLRETISAAMTHMANLRYNFVAVVPVYNDLMRLEGAEGPVPMAPQSQPPAPLRLDSQIELHDVWYRYDQADVPALEAIDLTIPVGAAIGFVGSTGAGKSTLVDVVLGLLEPVRGEVRVDGTDIRKSGVGAWQAAIGYVPQSIYLLDDTIRRNIALGLADDEVDEDALWTAIKAAQLERFVTRQRGGLDEVIGEHGVRLSGGERQRIGIARALYNNPQVLVLDEATSSLDNATERAVISAVDSLKGQRTIVMIAHRLTTVRNCDRLYFLKDGRIEAAGTYSELELQHPEFRLMTAG